MDVGLQQESPNRSTPRKAGESLALHRPLRHVPSLFRGTPNGVHRHSTQANAIHPGHDAFSVRMRRWVTSVAKIVHIYDLSYAVEYGCEYRLRAEEA